MKRLRIFVVAAGLALVGTLLHAQAPRTFSYQGVLTDGSGEPVSNGPHTITVSLYNVVSGGSALFTETHPVTTDGGIFNLIIGSSSAIPPSLDFKGKYWLGVSVDGGNELAPRTALTSVPYAVSAEYATLAGTASGLAPGATGVVTSLNGQSGAVTLQGGGGTTVTQNGSTITISSTGGAGGNGIQGVQNTDGILGITNPNGPVATINVNDGGITSAKIADAAVRTPDLADNSVTSAKIVDGTIATDDLANNSVSGAKVVDGTIATADIADEAVTSEKIADGDIGTADLADNAVTSAKIADGGVATADLADDAVTSAKIVDGGVQNSDLADNSVTGTRIADGAVTETKIADNAVTTNKIAAGAVTLAKISNTGASNGKVLKYNGSNVVWGSDDGLTLPSTTTVSTSSDVLNITNTGPGNIIYAYSNSDTSINTAIYAKSKGLGATVYITKSGSSVANAALSVQSSAGTAVFGRQDGATGQAAIFRIYNAANNAAALEVSTAGTGTGTYSYSTGTGRAGNFTISNGNSTADALYATTNGSGHAIYSAGTAYKTVGGNTWSIPSDARLKEDVLPFTDGLSLVEQIRPVRYHYNGLAGTQKDREEYGVIAQEIGAIAPYTVEPRTVAVDPNDQEKGTMDILTYNSGPLTYVMINAIKELNAKIDAVSAKVGGQSQGADASELKQLREENRALRLEVEGIREQLQQILKGQGN